MAPVITQKGTRVRKAIGPAERLSLSLHDLAYGDSQHSNPSGYRIGRSTASKIIRETCEALWTVLHEEYLKPPNSDKEWKEIANEFQCCEISHIVVGLLTESMWPYSVLKEWLVVPQL